MVTPVTYFDLIDYFPQPGCAICNLLRRNVDRSLDALLYEYVGDPDSHRVFRQRRGLCNEHSWHEEKTEAEDTAWLRALAFFGGMDGKAMNNDRRLP